jgi:uncharacterized protein with HEPN domain
MARRPKDDRALVLDMVAAAEAALRFVDGLGREAFMRSEKDQFAVTRAVEIVGEAASRLSPAFMAALPGVPWRSIIGMRHRIVHGYDEVDIAVVCKVATVDLPDLLHHLGPVAPPRGSG